MNDHQDPLSSSEIRFYGANLVYLDILYFKFGNLRNTI